MPWALQPEGPESTGPGPGRRDRVGTYTILATPTLLTSPRSMFMPDDQVVLKPTVFLLFGATGDLAHRLVLPALFRLAQANLLPPDWRLIGNGRGDASHENFQDRVQESLEEFGPKPSEGPW